MFGDELFTERPPIPERALMTADDLSRLSGLELRALEACAARANKRVLLCPKCSARLWKDGKRRGGVQAYVCPVCGPKSCGSASTSLASSKLTMPMMEKAMAPIMLGCPDWVVAWIFGISQKTAQFWRGGCLDASLRWSAESRLSGHVRIGEVRFAPAGAAGLAKGAWTTYAGRMAKGACLEVASDAGGNGFCKLRSDKLGTPARGMVLDALGAGSRRGPC